MLRVNQLLYLHVKTEYHYYKFLHHSMKLSVLKVQMTFHLPLAPVLILNLFLAAWPNLVPLSLLHQWSLYY